MSFCLPAFLGRWYVSLSFVYFRRSWLVPVVWFRVVLMRSWLSGYRLPISIKQSSPFLHVCTVTVPKYRVEPTMKAPLLFQRKMLKTTRGIARPHRKYRSLATPVPRLQSLCDIRTKSLGSCSRSAPLCLDSDLCQDSDPCQDSDTYGTQFRLNRSCVLE